jgi:hypothetical protein
MPELILPQQYNEPDKVEYKNNGEDATIHCEYGVAEALEKTYVPSYW